MRVVRENNVPLDSYVLTNVFLQISAYEKGMVPMTNLKDSLLSTFGPETCLGLDFEWAFEYVLNS